MLTTVAQTISAPKQYAVYLRIRTASKMDETKQKMDDLRNRTGEYADVSSTIYYNYLSDGETLDFYGLERGETDDMLTEYDYAENWATPSRIEDDKINSLYTNDPDQNQYWPIWQVFIDASNGMLNNDPVN